MPRIGEPLRDKVRQHHEYYQRGLHRSISHQHFIGFCEPEMYDEENACWVKTSSRRYSYISLFLRLRLIHFILIVLVSLSNLSASQKMPFDAREATIDSVHHALFSGLSTCREVVEAFLARIETFNNFTNAIISLNLNALEVADSMDEILAAGNATGPLFGVPILLKDNYDTAGIPTTGGNLALTESQPTEDAPSVAALKKAGAIILGKANLHELALEGISVSSLGGQTMNPYDSTRTPGGSSGGTGAAVASSFCVFGTGTDTVNSLRSPASANSLFSCRPTRGLITRTGIIPISYTQDTIGPIGRTLKDVAVALTVMASTGYDAADNATALVPPANRDIDYAASISSGTLQGVRIGVLNGFFNRTTSNETTPVNIVMDAMMQKLTSAGATLIPINETIYNATSILALDTQRYEYRELMDQYLTRPSLAGKHPATLKDLYATAPQTTNGTSGQFLVIPAQYEYVNTALISSTANSTYSTIQSDIKNLTLALPSTFALHKLSAVIYPEQKNLVVKLGSSSQSGRNGILAALTGCPVVTVPAGFSEPSGEAPIGVPIGMEILGLPWSEEMLLQIGYQIEGLTKVRRAPKWAGERVEGRAYERVPVVRPERWNIPEAYPLGTLQV
ncbi:amidase signature domain-containing protein [Clohesyomyces aquaticus]|uniref:Amidase signature domain-containing protein n=1 Tax=Clohesyomyces aquaticus TaxID=1231657 RepID=A0A1Y1ZID0_9PLEO|nr:amidase signature domain-containing protein [Clohesyomyces aquaticus]